MGVDLPRASVITVLNLKGGVGKTHTSWLLASVCEERGKRLLAIDTDPQGNLSSSFLASDAIEPGMEILFDPSTDISMAGLVRRTKFSHIDVVPTGPKLARFDLSDQRQWEAADLHLTLRDADWGAQGIMQVTEAIEHVRQYFNPRLQLLGYMVSRFKRSRSVQKAYLRELREHFGAKAFDTVIPDLASFEQSVIERIPVTLRPRHRRAADIAREFFDEVERRIADLQPGGRAGRATDVREPAVIAA